MSETVDRGLFQKYAFKVDKHPTDSINISRLYIYGIIYEISNSQLTSSLKKNYGSKSISFYFSTCTSSLRIIIYEKFKKC